MKKQILNLKGANELSNLEKKSINGGDGRGGCVPEIVLMPCNSDSDCPFNTYHETWKCICNDCKDINPD